MDPQITLTTSDDPPVSLIVSRSALVTQSKVFADMLSLNLESEDADKSIPVAETEGQLKFFLSIIGDGEEGSEKVLSSLDEAGWETLAMLADKYDCILIRKEVQVKIWEIEAKGESPAFGFTLATIIGDKRLICYTAKRAVRIKDLTDSGFHAAHEWKERLAFWRTLHAANVFSTFHRYKNHSLATCCSFPKSSWTAMGGFAFANYDSFNTPPLALSQYLSEIRGCSVVCRDQLRQHVQEFEGETSEWKEFPVREISAGYMGDTLMWKI